MSDHTLNVEVKMGSEQNFGIVIGAVFALIGVWPLLFGGDIRLLFMVAALAMFIMAFFFPRVLTRPNVLWFKFGMLLGAIVAPIVMGLVFFTTFVPMGGLLRLLGKDLLDTKLEPETSSYWIMRTDEPQSMKKQF